MYITIQFFAIILAMAAFSGCGRLKGDLKGEQSTQPSKTAINSPEQILPLAGANLRKSLTDADLIVVASITEVSGAQPGEPGVILYLSVEIKVEKVLRGNAPNILRMTIGRRCFPPDRAEIAPEIGDVWLILLTTKEKPALALKVLAPTPENIRLCSSQK